MRCQWPVIERRSICYENEHGQTTNLVARSDGQRKSEEGLPFLLPPFIFYFPNRTMLTPWDKSAWSFFHSIPRKARWQFVFSIICPRLRFSILAGLYSSMILASGALGVAYGRPIGHPLEIAVVTVMAGSAVFGVAMCFYKVHRIRMYFRSACVDGVLMTCPSCGADQHNNERTTCQNCRCIIRPYYDERN